MEISKLSHRVTILRKTLGTDEGLHLQEIHAGQLHAGLAPAVAYGTFHFRDLRNL